MTMGRERVRIATGAARLPDGTLAGAIISMLDGARMMVRKAGAAIGEIGDDGGDESGDADPAMRSAGGFSRAQSRILSCLAMRSS